MKAGTRTDVSGAWPLVLHRDIHLVASPVTACMASKTMLKSKRVTTQPHPFNLLLLPLPPAAAYPAGHARDTYVRSTYALASYGVICLVPRAPVTACMASETMLKSAPVMAHPLPFTCCVPCGPRS
jgi:hypothetical protein